MSNKNLFSIEIHRHREPKVNTFMTEKCLGFTYTTSVMPPHAQGSYSFSLRVADADMILPGDWLIHRDARGYAGFWGRVASVSDGLVIEGNQAVATAVTQVTVEGWTEVLQKAMLFTPGGYIKESHGTLFSIQDWTVKIGKFLGTFSSDPLGKSLQTLLQIVGRVRLPETMGGGWLGDEVKVVYDKVTAHLYAPELVDEMDALPAANMAPDHVSTQSVEANAYDIMRQLYVPEPALIEMFPYTSVRYEAQQSTSGTSESTEPSEADTVSPGETTYPPWANPQPATTAKSFSILGNVLRGRPVLVYRVAPWRTRPLRESIFAQEEEPQKYLSAPDAMGGPLPASEQAKRFPILDVMFTEATWTNGNLIHIPSEYVHGFSRQRDDSMRLNCVWMAQGTGLGVEAIQQAGLPVMIHSEIEENGLRAKSPTWPFFIRRGDLMSSDEGSYLEYVRMLSAQVMQFHHRGHVMGQGQISMAYAPALVQNAYDRVSRQQDRAPLMAGRAIVLDMPTGTPPFFAYADSVTHSVRVADAQAVEGTTTIQYTRGLYGWDEDALRDSPIPVPSVVPAAQPAAQAATSASNRTHVRPPGCPGGKAVLARRWPSTALPDLACPPWLITWGASRVSWDGGASAAGLSNRMSRILRGTAEGVQPIETHNAQVMAAAMYVIYRYWRQVYPACSIHIAGPNGWKRNSSDTTHGLSAGIDFYIATGESVQRVEAHRTWGALWKLARAGRIPFGGKGLYLNVNPETGWTATSVTDFDPRGTSRGTGVYAGPGGSAGVHYDLRGAFGVFGPNGSGANSWLATDWDGDGRDEVELGEVYSSGSVTVTATYSLVFANIADTDGLLVSSGLSDASSRVHAMLAGPREWFDEASRVPVRDAIRQYVLQTRGDDATLPPVSADVPNVLQVLGLEPWCEASTTENEP